MVSKAILRNRNRILRIVVILLLLILIIAFWTPINRAMDEVYITQFGEGYQDTIKIKQEDVNWLNKNYEVYDSEFGICMDKELYKGQEVYAPARTTLTKVNESSVSLICSQADQWILHSHPNGICELSQQDINTTKTYSGQYMGIWCGQDYYKIFNKDIDRVQLEVIE